VNPVITHPEVLEQLVERIDELEKRVIRLETLSVPASPSAVSAPIAAKRPIDESGAASQVGASLTVIGKALLGIAGAYLLRAIASPGAVPRSVVACFATLYAMAWLVAAVRKAAGSRIGGVAYAATSALILAPMLWEMCLRFQAMSSLNAAVVLAVYVALIAILAERARDTSGVAVAYAASALTALALSVATHSMAPFTVILLAIVLLGEWARIRDRAFPVAPLVLLAADIGVWAFLFIYRTPVETRPEYPVLHPLVVVAAPLLLFAIHMVGLAIHTLARRRSIAVLDALQAMVAFSLVACAFIWLAPDHSRASLGILCLALAGACYWLFIGLFRHGASPRTVHILQIWGAALLFCSVFLLLSLTAAAVVCGVLAAAAMLAARRFRYSVLVFHGVLLVAVALFASGALQYTAHCLVGPIPGPPDWAIPAAAALTILTYVICAAGSDAANLVARFITALLGTLSLSALLIRAIIAAVGSISTVDSFHVAVLRTIVLCGLALLLAFAGSRLCGAEIAWMAYGLVAFVTAKLLFEDLRHGRLEFAAASICLVALTFILVPRITGRSRSRSGATQGAN
jgi:hypothetical protein